MRFRSLALSALIPTVAGSCTPAPTPTVESPRPAKQSISETPSSTLDGTVNGAAFSASVSSAGDINDDGYADLIIGALNLPTFVFQTLFIAVGEHHIRAEVHKMPRDG
ncbi:MAG: FG-GAP repeat protein, partial [Myxococcota bacterium]